MCMADRVIFSSQSYKRPLLLQLCYFNNANNKSRLLFIYNESSGLEGIYRQQCDENSLSSLLDNDWPQINCLCGLSVLIMCPSWWSYSKLTGCKYDRHCLTWPLLCRQEYETKLLSLFSDNALWARSESQRWCLGSLLPAIAAIWGNGLPSTRRLLMSSSSMDFEARKDLRTDAQLVNVSPKLLLQTSSTST